MLCLHRMTKRCPTCTVADRDKITHSMCADGKYCTYCSSSMVVTNEAKHFCDKMQHSCERKILHWLPGRSIGWEQKDLRHQGRTATQYSVEGQSDGQETHVFCRRQPMQKFSGIDSNWFEIIARCSRKAAIGRQRSDTVGSMVKYSILSILC